MEPRTSQHFFIFRKEGLHFITFRLCSTLQNYLIHLPQNLFFFPIIFKQILNRLSINKILRTSITLLLGQKKIGCTNFCSRNKIVFSVQIEKLHGSSPQFLKKYNFPKIKIPKNTLYKKNTVSSNWNFFVTLKGIHRISVKLCELKI